MTTEKEKAFYEKVRTNINTLDEKYEVEPFLVLYAYWLAAQEQSEFALFDKQFHLMMQQYKT